MSKLTAVSGTPTAEEELADATDTTLGHNTGDGTRGGGEDDAHGVEGDGGVPGAVGSGANGEQSVPLETAGLTRTKCFFFFTRFLYVAL